jgi:hypothetical protein
MMITVAMVGYAVGYVLAAATRTEGGPALYVPVPHSLRRFMRR